MVEFTAPSRRTVVLSISAVLGLAAISSLAYLYIRDNKRSLLSRRFRSLQKSLHSQLFKAQDTLDDLVENDLRLIQVRVKTLRMHRLYPSDPHVQLPSLGLINEQDQTVLGDQIEESKEELIRERTLGFEDPAKVRQGYQQLEMLAQALHQQLRRLMERVDAVDVSELAEIGDEVEDEGSPIVSEAIGSVDDEATKKKKAKDEAEKKGSALQAMDKIRKHRRSVLGHIRQVVTQLDRIRVSYQDRLQSLREYEKKDRMGLDPFSQDAVEPTIDHELMKQGMTFAKVAAMNIEEPEILAPTEDLEKMKQGVTFADVVAEHLPEETHQVLKPTEDLEKMQQGVTFADVAGHGVKEEEDTKEQEVLAPTEDLELMKQGVTFADVVSHGEEEDTKDQEVLAPTEDLELMKQGVTFADVVGHGDEDQEVLAPTEDLELMKQGVTFADVVGHGDEEENTEDQEVLAPTEDLELMKQGVSFAEMTKHNIEAPSDETTHVLPAADDRKRTRHEGAVDGVAEV